MGKVSVFKFNVNGQNSEYAKNMVGNYLNTRGLYIEDVTDYTPSLAATGHKISTYEVEGLRSTRKM